MAKERAEREHAQKLEAEKAPTVENVETQKQEEARKLRDERVKNLETEERRRVDSLGLETALTKAGPKAWQFSGNRFRSIKGASSKDAWAAALQAFIVSFPVMWWASGDLAAAMVSGIGLGIACIFYSPKVAAWCLVLGVGFILWNLLPPYWNWGAALLVVFWGYADNDS